MNDRWCYNNAVRKNVYIQMLLHRERERKLIKWKNKWRKNYNKLQHWQVTLRLLWGGGAWGGCGGK